MLDPKLLRTEFDEVAKHLSRRGISLDKKRFSELEEQRKNLQVETEDLQGQRNKNSKLIGQAKSKGEDASEIMISRAVFTPITKNSSTEISFVEKDRFV